MSSTVSAVKLFLLIIACFNGFDKIGAQSGDGPIVQVQQGTIQGKIQSTPQGREFNSFLGIPFGKAPIGDLRFSSPLPVDPWAGVLNTTVDPPKCIQPVFGLPTSYTGEEDCLQLNVYSPILPTAENPDPALPVNVFIHGGDYFGGEITSTHFGPERFMNTDMVLVLPNYRLDTLGFIGTNDDAASGNFGLLDQQLALQWVRDNIAAFGGNPDTVTLSGQSAGSSSVLSHILAPSSTGLFHQVIAESGAALCPWAFEESPLFYAQKIAELLDCPTNDTTELISCLRQVDAGLIIEKSATVMADNLTLSYVPVVENPTSGVYITEDPMTLLQEGRFIQVPLLTGFNRDEGVLIYKDVVPLFTTIDDRFFDVILPDLILPAITDYRHNLLNVSYAIKDEYYSDIDLENSTQVTRTSIDLISDIYMKTPGAQTAQLISSHGVPVYLYEFNYVSNQSTSNFTGEPDVVHSSEMWYLYNETDHVMSDEDKPFGDKFFNLWVNFIINGNPTPSGPTQWLPTAPGGTQYLDINTEFTMVDIYDPERMDFWTNIVPAIVAA